MKIASRADLVRLTKAIRESTTLTDAVEMLREVIVPPEIPIMTSDEWQRLPTWLQTFVLEEGVSSSIAVQNVLDRLQRAYLATVAPKRAGEPQRYEGPIEVGMHFLWMKETPAAWARVVVTRVADRDSDGSLFDERRIWTRTLSHSRSNPEDLETWNDEGRCREAFTPCDDKGNVTAPPAIESPKVKKEVQ